MTNAEKARAWRQANPDRAAENRKRWRKNNPDRLAAIQRNYHQTKKPKVETRTGQRTRPYPTAPPEALADMREDVELFNALHAAMRENRAKRMQRQVF